MMRFAATVVIVLIATGCGDDKASPTAPSPISINRTPQASGSIPDVALVVNGAATTIDITAQFSDPDGDTLSYSVSSAGDSVTVSISGSAVSLAPVRAALVHKSKLTGKIPTMVPHRPMAYEFGRPMAVIVLSMLHVSSVSAVRPPGVLARRPSPIIDLYRKNALSTRACCW